MSAARNVFGAFAVLLPLDVKFVSVEHARLVRLDRQLFVGLNLYLTETTVCLNYED
jgi:hypothetical protein